MKTNRKWITAVVFCSLLLCGGIAQGADVAYTKTHVFSINDVQCDRGVVGTVCLNMSAPVLGADGLLYYPIDSAYGWDAKDFDPSALLPRPMDGVYAEGFITNLVSPLGQVIGINVQDVETANWKAGPIGGEWVAGLGALKAKTATEHYVVMDHILNATWMPPLVEGVDYSTRLKDDGKILYFWGNYNKEPTPVYIYTALPLPDSWKMPGANYTVKSAKLTISHRITNSPNDQIRPEDFENELATGVLPKYTVAPDGSWLSAVESYEGGDGEYLPVGTVLRDTAGNYTNAWYVTLDRDPFGGPSPRYRLKSSKFGQDLPGVEIPQYPVGEPTTTTIDLLAPMRDAVTGLPGPSVLTQSTNWNAYLDANDGVLDGFTVEDCRMTPDFNLMIYIKGEVGKPTPLYTATLEIVYDDPAGTSPPPAPSIDLSITAVTAPNKITPAATTTVSVTVKNELPGAAPGTITLTGTDKNGVIVGSYSLSIVTTADSTSTTYGFGWTAPAYQTNVTWLAKVAGTGDINLANNTKTATTLVK